MDKAAHLHGRSTERVPKHSQLKRFISAPKKKLPSGFVTVYTDASHKDGIFSWGCYIKAEWGKSELHGICPDEITDINLAEAYAIGQSIYKSLKKWPGVKGFYVRSDSMNAIGMLKTGTKNTVGARIKASVDSLTVGLVMDWKWIKSHQRNSSIQAWVNNRADALARKARQK